MPRLVGIVERAALQRRRGAPLYTPRTLPPASPGAREEQAIEPHASDPKAALTSTARQQTKGQPSTKGKHHATMATSLKISDEPLFTADDPRFREEMIWQYSANCAQAKVNKSGWATKKTHNPIEWTEAAPAPRQLERVAEAEARAEADRRKRVAAMVQLAEDSLAEQRLADGIVEEASVEEEGVEEEVITPAKPEIVQGSSELLPPDVWAPPQPELTEEDEEPITKEAPVKPDEDARGIIGLWFEGNVRARAYRKMGRA